ncbi:macrolide ABC transporter ATP-binding protein [Amycolatopsis sp. WAC 01416]|uniref:ABC transporter ATP-binding protein n=1 Tax=Amycolatopsis sp. WAC 01416 TaxID=2203196 RepID=UPI000F780CA6|nr:ABC transporter ATP-binding protein [Amycolatopsis sp. WAC 01416]RSN36310.1 macrolide ABC transporter ATP-binding protein [Amycolatopsis sp. WAC 01416]
METPLLHGLGLHKAFGPNQALAGAGLTVEAGEIVAIMGPSGSGKSTLLHCLSGILRPDGGQVLFRGRDLAIMPDAERSALRRTEFGFVFQFGQLVPELTCLENVALPLRLGGMKRRPAEHIARDWLDRLEVGDSDDSTPGRISGGESQRVAMARALITEPSVIFADEPTGALDSLSGELVMRLLSETAKQTDAAVVLVTHEPRVAAYSDREVIVRDGRTREPVVTR